MCPVVFVQCHTDLPQIVLALGPPRGLASRLRGWQDQRNKNANDRDDGQQLNERDCIAQRRTNT
jgi:hypothetical protein